MNPIWDRQLGEGLRNALSLLAGITVYLIAAIVVGFSDPIAFGTALLAGAALWSWLDAESKRRNR